MDQCKKCGVYTSNGDQHSCVEYDPNHPCPACGAGMVFVHISAPGTGSGWVCENGHYHGDCRELVIDEVI